MRKRIITIALVLIMTALACRVDGDPTPSWERSISATATYGAEQWHAQLTEMAKP